MTRPAPLLRGGSMAFLAAAFFGVSTPFVQRFGTGVGPFATAALLYAGAFLLMGLLPRTAGETRPSRRDAPRWAVTALLGAAIAPACLAWGLARTDASLASLLLATEAGFTVILARALYDEPIGRRVWVALTLMAGGSALLVSTPVGHAGWGALAVLGAAFAWASDSALTRPLSERDPRTIVLGKAAMGALASGAIAAALREPLPALGQLAGLVVAGALGYGASLVFYLRAQRALGAARTGTVFASAPFLGAITSWAMGQSHGSLNLLLAAALFAAAVLLQITEAHAHEHLHGAALHEHPHRHDDGHHFHTHDPPVTGEHVHPHEHTPLRHVHPHGIDPDHRHEH